MPTVRIHFAPLCLLGALLSGCSPPTTIVRTRVLRLKISEYRVEPAAIQASSRRLKIIVTNTGILAHNLRLIADAPGRAASQPALGGTTTLKPGETVTVKIPSRPDRPLKPGKYKLIDSIANHTELGDYATLLVK